MIRLAAVFAAALAACAPAAAQPTATPDACAELAGETAEAPAGFPWPDSLARPAPGATENIADLEDACREDVRKRQKEDARQKRRDDDARRYDAIPGPGTPGEGRSDFSETMAPPAAAGYEAQRLRTAHRINQQGIQTAQRGDWIAALQMFEMAARYAPRDPVIQRNLAEARVRAARQADELRRERRGR